ncbi:MAG: DUF6754 domain-containing protein [Chloroflexota bacterium]
MPNLGELAAQVIGILADTVGSSSLRLHAAPTLAILLIILVLLSLVARPSMRWVAADLGSLGEAGRAMALAAESGADAAVSLGSAGIVRTASAVERFQTLAALPVLGHLARAAARAGVPLRATANDPVTVLMAEAVLVGAHRRTSTPERAAASTIEYLGEGRAVAAAAALSDARPHGVAMVAGGLGEEGILLLDGVLRSADWSVAATPSPAQAAGPLLLADGALIGPEMLQAPAQIAHEGHARMAVQAANRLIWTVVGVLLGGSLVGLLGWPGMAEFLAGR